MKFFEFSFKKEIVSLSFFLCFFIQIFTFPLFLQAKELPEIASSDRLWLEKFFKDVMLEESAIYTLFGSKPMTSIPVYYFTEEEKEVIYSQMTEEELASAIYVSDYDLPENLEKWESLQPLFPISKYLFFRIVDEDPRFADIYFVNIEKICKH